MANGMGPNRTYHNSESPYINQKALLPNSNANIVLQISLWQMKNKPSRTFHNNDLSFTCSWKHNIYINLNSLKRKNYNTQFFYLHKDRQCIDLHSWYNIDNRNSDTCSNQVFYSSDMNHCNKLLCNGQIGGSISLGSVVQ